MSSALTPIGRFFGFGSDLAQSGGSLGLGSEMGQLGNISPEFRGHLSKAHAVKFSDATPSNANRSEQEAQKLNAQSRVYRQLLKSEALKAQSYAGAAQARMQHDVRLSQINTQMVAAQGRTVQTLAEHSFKNSIAASGTAGAVQGYTEQNAVFSF